LALESRDDLGFQSGQQIIRFAWNKEAGKAYPIYIKKGTTTQVPLHFSKVMNNPNLAPIEWHPEYARKMLEYEIDLLDYGKANQFTNFDATHYQENRDTLKAMLSSLNANYQILARQAEQKRGKSIDVSVEKDKAKLDFIKKVSKDPETHVADVILAENIMKELQGSAVRESLLYPPVGKSTVSQKMNLLIKINSKIKDPKQHITSQQLETVFAKMRYVNAFNQGASDSSGGQTSADLKLTGNQALLQQEQVRIKNLLAQETIGVPRKIDPEELIRSDLPLPPNIKLPPPTLPTQTRGSLSVKLKNLQKAREELHEDDSLSKDDKKELLKMNENTITRTEYRITQFGKKPEEKFFIPEELKGTTTPISPLKLIYDMVQARKQGDFKRADELKKQVEEIKKTSQLIQTKGQIGGEREISAVFGTQVCSNCKGIGRTSFGRICKTCGGSGFPRQIDYGKPQLKGLPREGVMGTSQFFCKLCNQKGFADPKCRSCHGYTLIRSRVQQQTLAGEKYVKSVSPLENLYYKQGEFAPKIPKAFQSEQKRKTAI